MVRRCRCVWQCNLAESGDPARWADYEKEETDLIESAWQKGRQFAAMEDYYWGDVRWIASLERMQQLTVNVDHDSEFVERARPIRRLVLTHD